MNKYIGKILRHKTVDFGKLEPYGFVLCGDFYEYVVPIADGSVRMTVRIDSDGGIDAEVTDCETGEPYTLFLAENAVGGFVGEVRTDYERTLACIADECFETEVFKSIQAKQAIEYARTKYGDSLEFLWKKYDGNAVLRRKDTGKWYAAFLTVCGSKFGRSSDEFLEIIDLRALPEEIDGIADNRRYFRGYHMNKKHWLTVCFDGSVGTEEILRRIDDSYLLAEK